MDHQIHVEGLAKVNVLPYYPGCITNMDLKSVREGRAGT